MITGVVIQGLLIVVCVLKGKYRAALISCFVPVVSWVCATRLARPNSWWARHFYGAKREARAIRRGEKFDKRWDPKARWLSDLIAGAPSEPDPPDIQAARAEHAAAVAAEEAAIESAADRSTPGGSAVHDHPATRT